jgi:hypothetical protein
MPAPFRKHRFRLNEIRRAIRAVSTTGQKIDRVMVEPASGNVTIFIAGRARPPIAGGKNVSIKAPATPA